MLDVDGRNFLRDNPADKDHAFLLNETAAKNLNLDNLVIVSPDVGSVTRARSMADPLDAPIAIVDKRRPKANDLGASPFS